MKLYLGHHPKQTLNTPSSTPASNGKKSRRETILLYGAWTVLVLSMLAMVVPTSNSHSLSESQVIDGIEVDFKSGSRASQ